MIQKPNLLKVRNYKVNDKISVHVPTVDEIFDFGDQKYYSIVQTLVATPLIPNAMIVSRLVIDRSLTTTLDILNPPLLFQNKSPELFILVTAN